MLMRRRTASFSTTHCSCGIVQEVDQLLEDGVGAVTTAVKRCLQFYVNAGAITRSTEESLRSLLASLEAHD